MRQICSCAFGRKDCKKRKGTMKPRLAKQMVKGLRLCENVTTTGRKRQMIHQQYEVDDIFMKNAACSAFTTWMAMT